MWLPTPIYERTPQLWILMAILFIVLGLYVGFAYKLTIFYLGLGVFCAARGIHIVRMRRNYRRKEHRQAKFDNVPAIETAGN